MAYKRKFKGKKFKKKFKKKSYRRGASAMRIGWRM